MTTEEIIQRQFQLMAELSAKVDDLSKKMDAIYHRFPLPNNINNEIALSKTTTLDTYTDHFFTEHNIHYEGCIEEVVKSKALDQIVTDLGHHFRDFAPVMQRIKQTLIKSGSFSIFRKQTTHFEMIKSVCDKLYRIGYLDEFANTNDKLIISPSRLPVAHNFFTGFWLERYIFLMIDKVLKHFGLREKTIIYRNMVVTIPEVGAGELDVLMLVNNKHIWIEIKSGEFQNYLYKYQNIKEELGFNDQQCVLVVNELNPEYQQILSQSTGFVVSGIENFSAIFSHIIKNMQNQSTKI